LIAEAEIDEKHVELTLRETSRWEDLDPEMGGVSYPNGHAVLVCFAIDSFESLVNVEKKVGRKQRFWLPAHYLAVV
jgi:Ras homolog gene family, member A